MAYRMVTINPAVYFGMDHEVGGIAPGRYADILALKDLVHPTPEIVISKGRIIAEHSNLLEPFPWEGWEAFFPTASFSGRCLIFRTQLVSQRPSFSNSKS
ncbi:MAG: amidohydrolase family protein [Deltaproteobacteria bacterium]|nr:amidohydrolase family protein [Deltaproteobacteria bacterium]